MKYILFLFLIIVVRTTSYSQYNDEKSPTWFYMGAGGGFGNSMFFEKHFFEGVEITANAFNPSYSYYGKFGVGFPFNMGLVYEYSGQTLSQKYEVTSNVVPFKGENYTEQINLKTSGHTIMIRGGSPSSGYVEFGPRFSTVTSKPAFTGQNAYSEKYISGEFGFGGPLYYHEAFDISLGVRLNYALTNLMEDDHYPYAGPKYNTSGYSDLYTTNPFSFNLRLEMHWRIGYFRKAQCDGHIEFLMFGK